jgi:hypothetical protein
MSLLPVNPFKAGFWFSENHDEYRLAGDSVAGHHAGHGQHGNRLG